MQCKVFGERHTGTNALQNFLGKNFETQVRDYSFLGWKHRRAPASAEWKIVNYVDTLFIFMVRNPYSWVKSMHREPYHYHMPQIASLPFEQFLLHPFEDYQNLLQMWNEKYAAYLRMADEVPWSVLVKLEDFQHDQRAIYHNLCGHLKPKPEGFSPFTKYTNGTEGVTDRNLSVQDKKEHQLRAGDYSIINYQIDPAIVRRLGYDLVNPNTADS